MLLWPSHALACESVAILRQIAEPTDVSRATRACWTSRLTLSSKFAEVRIGARLRATGETSAEDLGQRSNCKASNRIKQARAIVGGFPMSKNELDPVKRQGVYQVPAEWA